jgi:hypothetical protein
VHNVCTVPRLRKRAHDQFIRQLPIPTDANNAMPVLSPPEKDWIGLEQDYSGSEHTYDNASWNVIEGTWSHTLVCRHTSQRYVVPINRINKAMKLLHQPSILAVMATPGDYCDCTRACGNNIGVRAMQDLRFKLAKVDCEINQLAEIVKLLAELWLGGNKFKYLVDGVEVCSKFWMVANGISHHKLKRAKQAIYNGNEVFSHGNSGYVYTSM